MVMGKLPVLKSWYHWVGCRSLVPRHDEPIVGIHKDAVGRDCDALTIAIGEISIKCIIGDDLTGEKGCGVMDTGWRARASRVESGKLKEDIVPFIARMPECYAWNRGWFGDADALFQSHCAHDCVSRLARGCLLSDGLDSVGVAFNVGSCSGRVIRNRGFQLPRLVRAPS